MNARRTLSVLVLSLFAIAAASAATAPALPASAASAPKLSLDVKSITLDNGLRIFVLERTTSPTFAAVYQFDVGGAVDPKGKSGIAHLLEHMMFKGTTNVGTLDWAKEKPLLEKVNKLWLELHAEMDKEDDPFQKPDQAKIDALRKEIDAVTAEEKKLIVKNEFDQVVQRAGSVGLNASTGNDYTNYYMQMPANRLELWFKMESDRLLNPVFREFWSERDVVFEERRLRTENSPIGTSFEALDALMFPATPYGTPVVGWPHDIARLRHDDAMNYFKTYYSPSNCVMALVGDVKTSDVEKLAKKYFGPWQRQTIPTRVVTAEPEQRGERRRAIEFDAEPSLRAGWPTVAEGHPDSYPLEILGFILGGLDSSRLDKTMVQKDRIAASVSSGQNSLKHAGFFMVSATPKGDTPVATLETAVDREIKRIQDDGVTADELERAKVQFEASRVATLKSNMGQARRIADAVAVSGSLAYIDEYERLIDAVTADQVRDVAKKYLVAPHRNVVQIVRTPGGPTAVRGADAGHGRGGEGGARGGAGSKGAAAAMAMIEAAPPVELKLPVIGKDVDRVVLPSGVTVFIKEDHSAPTVDMGFTWLGGSNTAPVSDLARYSVASQLLNEGGTTSLPPEQVDERKEDLGTSFSWFLGTTESGGSFFSLKRNFDDAFALALDTLMQPRFDPGRFDTIKGQFSEGMKRRWDNPGSGVGVLVNNVLNGDHPRLGYVPSKSEIDAVTPEQVRDAWSQYLGRDNLYIAVVGDFDKKAMLDKIDRAFSGWRKAGNKERVFITRPPSLKAGAYLIEKQVPQPAIRITQQIAADRKLPLADHAALDVMNDILGGSGFRSRLTERLRSDEGLTYGVSSATVHQGRPGVPGFFSVGYQTKAVSVNRSINIVLEEIKKMVEKPVLAKEVQEQLDSWRNRFIFRYTNDFSIVSRLMSAELDDRPYDFDRQVLEAVQKVTPDDVSKAAKTWLKPENLTIAIFGSVADDDRKALETNYRLTVLPKDKVFTGGYDASAPAPAPPAGAQ